MCRSWRTKLAAPAYWQVRPRSLTPDARAAAAEHALPAAGHALPGAWRCAALGVPAHHGLPGCRRGCVELPARTRLLPVGACRLTVSRPRAHGGRARRCPTRAGKAGAQARAGPIYPIPYPSRAQEIGLNTAEFCSGGAFADALLALAPRAGPGLRAIRLIAAAPGRAKQSVLYGGAERLCMYRGAQACAHP